MNEIKNTNKTNWNPLMAIHGSCHGQKRSNEHKKTIIGIFFFDVCSCSSNLRKHFDRLCYHGCSLPTTSLTYSMSVTVLHISKVMQKGHQRLGIYPFSNRVIEGHYCSVFLSDYLIAGGRREWLKRTLSIPQTMTVEPRMTDVGTVF